MGQQAAGQARGHGVDRVPRHTGRGDVLVLAGREPQIAPFGLGVAQAHPARAPAGPEHPDAHQRAAVAGLGPGRAGGQADLVRPAADRGGTVGGQQQHVVPRSGDGTTANGGAGTTGGGPAGRGRAEAVGGGVSGGGGAEVAVGSGQQVLEVRRAAYLAPLAGDRGVRVQRAQRPQRRVDLRRTEVLFAVEGLPVEVGQFDDVRFDTVQPTHAGGHQVPRGGSAGTSDAHQQDPGTAQPQLRLPGVLPGLEVHPAHQRHAPAVPFAFPLGQLRRRDGAGVLHVTGRGQVRHGLDDVLGRQPQLRMAPGHLGDDVGAGACAVHGLDQCPHPAVGILHLGADAVDDAADPYVAVDRPVGAVLRLDPRPSHAVHRHLRAHLVNTNCPTEKGR